MEFKVKREDLLHALHATVNVVERRQTMAILSHLLLEVEGNQLALTATDLELELRALTPVRDAQAGSITVPARKLFDICRGLPEGSDIHLTVGNGKLTVRSGRSRFTLSMLDAQAFPVMEKNAEGHKIQLSKANIKRALDRTHFAMAHQDVRYYLNGLLISVNDTRLRTVATDGHRLALCDVFQHFPIEEELQVIVPRKAITELRRLLEDNDEDVEIHVTNNQMYLSLGALEFTTKLIDGRFPDYERVIPKDGDKRLTADRTNMHQALSRTAILSSDKFRGVRLELKEGLLKLQAENPEHEEAEEELEVSYENEAMEIGFNVSYLLDALSALEEERFTLELSNAKSSGLIFGVDDKTARYVVMPMQL
jgi:DNA polymerase-3 subunit beta